MCLSLVRRLVCCACVLALAIVASAYYAYSAFARARSAFVVAHPDAAQLLDAMRQHAPNDAARVAAAAAARLR
jgi:hypothetical protein